MQKEGKYHVSVKKENMSNIDGISVGGTKFKLLKSAAGRKETSLKRDILYSTPFFIPRLTFTLNFGVILDFTSSQR
jgi:hypothetical protein